MKYLSLILLLSVIVFPSFLYGQETDTTCICGKWSPSTNSSVIVEETPSYPGGYQAIKNLIDTNITIDTSINGKVELSFIISCTGNCCRFIIESNHGNISVSTEQKLIESLKKMGKWNPAKQRGKNVNAPFKVSITIINGNLKINGPIDISK